MADGKPLQATIEDQLSEDNITALVDKNLVTELDDIDFGAMRGEDIGENPSLGPETNSNTALSSVFVALCLRIVIAITNYERGDDQGREKLKL